MRTATVDRRLLWVSLGLMLFGLLNLYSAGQTDVPTRAAGVDRKSTRLNSSHIQKSRMPSSA